MTSGGILRDGKEEMVYTFLLSLQYVSIAISSTILAAYAAAMAYVANFSSFRDLNAFSEAAATTAAPIATYTTSVVINASSTTATPTTAPPNYSKQPTSTSFGWRKMLCHECDKDSHDISYRHCSEFHFCVN